MSGTSPLSAGSDPAAGAANGVGQDAPDMAAWNSASAATGSAGDLLSNPAAASVIADTLNALSVPILSLIASADSQDDDPEDDGQ